MLKFNTEKDLYNAIFNLMKEYVANEFSSDYLIFEDNDGKIVEIMTDSDNYDTDEDEVAAWNIQIYDSEEDYEDGDSSDGGGLLVFLEWEEYNDELLEEKTTLAEELTRTR